MIVYKPIIIINMYFRLFEHVIGSSSIVKLLKEYFILIVSAMVDEGTKRSLQSIPLLQTRASPRDKELWVQRLKEELMALIKVTSLFMAL